MFFVAVLQLSVPSPLNLNTQKKFQSVAKIKTVWQEPNHSWQSTQTVS